MSPRKKNRLKDNSSVQWRSVQHRALPARATKIVNHHGM